jgi:hypothetical protein
MDGPEGALVPHRCRTFPAGFRFDVECSRCGKEISVLRVEAGWLSVERGTAEWHDCAKKGANASKGARTPPHEEVAAARRQGYACRKPKQREPVAVRSVVSGPDNFEDDLPY